MPFRIALLRAVNVAGHGSVAMSAIRDLFAGLGLAPARTLAQSGNVVFAGGARGAASLERMIEDAAAARLGLRTAVFVRTASEWDAMIAANPFPGEAASEANRLVAMVLKSPPGVEAVAALQAAIAGPERVRAGSRHVTIFYPEGIGRSRLTSAMIERTLGSAGTARNWNTVLKLAAAARG
jgi:uncharacterized protein (DUF1697 family)